MFPFFKWTIKGLDVPVLGTIITGVFTAGVAFFMTLDALADAISIGTLMAFSLVCAGVVVLRYTGPGKRNYIPITLIVTFIIVVFIASMLFTHLSSFASSDALYYSTIGIIGLLALVAIGLCIALFFLKPHNIPTTFKCPLVPFVPCTGIAINCVMLAGLRQEAWIRLGVWLGVGLLIYVLYGIWNSKMRDYVAPPKEEDVPKSPRPPPDPEHSINDLKQKCAIH